MSYEARGVIRRRDFASQQKDYSGLKFGKITPTDIDGFIDFQDRAFVFIELKHGDAELPNGQRWALERVTNACASEARFAITLIAHHQSLGDIPVADLYVTEYFVNGRWRKPPRKISMRDMIEKILDKAGIVYPDFCSA